jgi:hypothetical protein
MRVLGTAALVVVLLICGCIAGAKLALPTYTYRYRMTVNVMVDGNIQSGSSVIEVAITKQPSGLPETRSLSGEAVFIDLGKRRNVIALLASGPIARDVDYPSYIAPVVFGLRSTDDLPKLSQMHGSRQVTSDRLPTFMTFTNLADPTTASVVPPDEFSQVFGADVRLIGVWVEMTSGPVTEGIEKRFPWWNGPFPWLKPIGSGTYVDTRPRDQLRWDKGMLKRNY